MAGDLVHGTIAEIRSICTDKWNTRSREEELEKEVAELKELVKWVVTQTRYGIHICHFSYGDAYIILDRHKDDYIGEQHGTVIEAIRAAKEHCDA